MTTGRSARTALVVLVAALVAASSAHARPNPATPGSAAGEPVAFTGLRVVRESLLLDLSPLARPTTRTATVEATYLIVNEGDAVRVPLSLVTPDGRADGARVWVDGARVAGERVRRFPIPEAWRVAEMTPALAGDAPPFATDTLRVRALSFVLDVPPGRHLVRMRYAVRPGSYDAGDHPSRVWQMAYSLAPARFWAGFGSLDVTVRVPSSWDVAASLPLRRDGGVLTATFAGVPGDVLTVSARAPKPRGRTALRLLGFALALLFCLGAGALGGRVTRQRGRPVALAWPASFAGGVAGAAALVWLSAAADALGDSTAFGSGRALVSLLVVGPLAVVLGTLLAQSVARAVHRGLPPEVAD